MKRRVENENSFSCFDSCADLRSADCGAVARGVDAQRKDIRYDVLSMITSDDIFEYQRYLELNIDPEHPHENDKKAIARKMSPLRGMFHYHMLHKNIKEDPTQLVPLPRLKKDKNIIRMNNFEVQAILNAVKNGNEQMSKRQRAACQRTQLRDFALLVLMLGTGIRVSECNGLDLNDVDLRANTITIVRKGGGQDVLYFGDAVHDKQHDHVHNGGKQADGRRIGPLRPRIGGQ